MNYRKTLLDAHETHYGGRDILNWTDPRSVITPKMEHDDMAYSISGMFQAATILCGLDLPLSELATMTLCDVGCGTGKVTRALQMFVRRAVGWDPKPECIAAARAETARCPLKSARWPPLFCDELPDEAYDLIVCTDVMPGLGLRKADAICETFGRLAAPGALLVANIRNFREPTITAMLTERGFSLVGPIRPCNPDALACYGFYLWSHA